MKLRRSDYRTRRFIRIVALSLVFFVALSVVDTGLYAPAVAPTAAQSSGLDFGAVPVGESGQLTAGIYAFSSNARDITVSSVQVTGPNADEFRVIDSGGTPFRLGPGASRDVVVEFTPKTPGTKTATLTFFSDADNGPVIYQITAVAEERDLAGTVLKGVVTATAASGAGVGADAVLSRRRRRPGDDEAVEAQADDAPKSADPKRDDEDDPCTA